MLLLQREVVCGGLEAAHGLLNTIGWLGDNGCLRSGGLGATDASQRMYSQRKKLEEDERKTKSQL